MLNWKTYLLMDKLDATGGDAGGGGAGGSEADKKKDEKDESQDSPDGKEGKGEDQLDVDKLPDAAKNLIRSLREENAKHRTKNRELGDSSAKLKKALVEAGIIENDEEAPEEKLKGMGQQLEGAQLRNALLEAALEHSVPKESLKYFQFLVAEKLDALSEDGELTQEEIAELALEARSKSGAGKASKTSVDGGKAGSAPPPGGDDRVTVDEFDSMTILEKSELFTKKPDVYQKLFNESKAKKLRR